MRVILKTAPLAGLMMIGWTLATPVAAAPAGIPAGPLASYAEQLGGTEEVRWGRRCWRTCYGPWWRRTCVKRCVPHRPRYYPRSHLRHW